MKIALIFGTRPEAIEVGTAKLIGTNTATAMRKDVRKMIINV